MASPRAAGSGGPASAAAARRPAKGKASQRCVHDLLLLAFFAFLCTLSRVRRLDGQSEARRQGHGTGRQHSPASATVAWEYGVWLKWLRHVPPGLHLLLEGRAGTATQRTNDEMDRQRVASKSTSIHALQESGLRGQAGVPSGDGGRQGGFQSFDRGGQPAHGQRGAGRVLPEAGAIFRLPACLGHPRSRSADCAGTQSHLHRNECISK